jgi:hypothetical protein
MKGKRTFDYMQGYRDGVNSVIDPSKVVHPIHVMTPAGARYYCSGCELYTQRLTSTDYYCRRCGAFIDWEKIEKRR